MVIWKSWQSTYIKAQRPPIALGLPTNWKGTDKQHSEAALNRGLSAIRISCSNDDDEEELEEELEEEINEGQHMHGNDEQE